MKKNKYILIFLIGVFIFIYPFISQIYYDIGSNNTINDFTEESLKLKQEDLNKKIELAKAYNSTLNPLKLVDPYSENVNKGIAEYARMLEVKEMLGHIEIPSLNLDVPIYAGTTEEVLSKGAGHLEGSSLPIGGQNTHTVITAHRGLSSAVMFRNLDKLKQGDIFLIHNIFGVLAYKVDKIQVVKPTNFEPVLVVPNQDYATLLTCDPYLINSHRLLVRGTRIMYNSGEISNLKSKNSAKEYIILICILILMILAILFILYRRKKSKYEKKV